MKPLSPLSRIHFLFAVVHEARPFLTALGHCGRAVRRVRGELRGAEAAWEFQGGTIRVSGMGARNAAATAEGLELAEGDLVITSGFAGGLNAVLATGDVVYEVDPGQTALAAALAATGARLVSFACEPRVASSREEKAVLRGRTKADVVEMESGVIRQVCRRRGVPSATVRVISDAAHEDLPLDFNALMTPDFRMDYGKLAWRLVRSPGRIPALMQFQQRLGKAAGKLATTLLILLAPDR